MPEKPRRDSELAASVIITTYNRCDALEETLRALDQQDLDPASYEILVVDNGCRDATPEVLTRFRPRCGFVALSVPENVGISGARNLALARARGEFVIFVSDDLIVPPEFLRLHLETHRAFPGFWVVGGFRQLDSLTESPFGRYLDSLETSFEEARKSRPLQPQIWELSYPTARNLSMRRADLEQIGVFDEQFRNACEDWDLAIRAQRALGTRFLYHEGITCLHNDQAGDLLRYCRAQQRGAHDTVLFCHKYRDWYRENGDAAIMRLNAPPSLADGPHLLTVKLLKAAISQPPVPAALEWLIRGAEKLSAPAAVLRRLYRLLIGIYMRRGWQEGLRTLAAAGSNGNANRLGSHSHV